MSNKEVQNTEEKKIVTKYDLKMQRREEEKAKAKREQRVSLVTGIVVVVALFCFVASFPIRSWLTVNGTYIKVGGEKVTRLEFDYYYHTSLNNYANTYGSYLSYMGIDLTGDLSKQMYSADLSFKDYFEEMAVENLTQNKALLAEAKAAGFTYDATAEYEEYVTSLKEAVAETNLNESEFIKDNFGPYATLPRVKKFILESLEATAYYNTVVEAKTPSDEEARAYYEENKDTYDSVDYRVTLVQAELPTEPTDLADPVEEKTAEGSAEASSDTASEAYEPSEAEIEFAMKNAKADADGVLKTIKTEGALQENQQKSDVSSKISDWLFDSERKAGDTTIIEDNTNYVYYVLAFEKRYLDETPTVDVRAVLLNDVDGETVLEEWKSGAATEDSFAELADKYNKPELTAAEGGFYDALMTDSIPSELADWLLDSSRVYGDTTVIAPEGDECTYVLYYIGTDKPQWMMSAKSTMLSDIMADYLVEIAVPYEVTDPKKNLNYLQVYAAQESAAAESEAAEQNSETQSSEEAGSETGSSAQ